MAVDEALLLDAAENRAAALRFYQWSEPTLSLGYFQRYEDRYQHEASRECAVVRRQSGGGAILHDRELTYSLALPASHPLARDCQRLYAAVHDAFIAELSTAIARTAPWQLARRDQESGPASLPEPFSCFKRRAPGDVVLIPAADSFDACPGSAAPITTNYKVLGSAQRRHRGAILQHGGLLLESSPAAPELPGLRDLTGLDLSAGNLLEAISRRLARTLDLQLIPARLSPQLESIARKSANSKYRADGWTKRR